MRFLAFSIVVASILGCAQPQAPVTSRPTSADDPTLSCFRSAFADPRLAPLTPRVGSVSTSSAITLDMLADKSTANEEERGALKVWGDARLHCLDLGKQFRANYAPPGWDAAYSRSQMDLVLLTARLYSGEISYGQFNTARQNIALNSRASLQAASQQDAERVAQEIAQQRAAAIQMFQHQQVINQMNRPRTTTCTGFGAMATCTSN